MKYLADQGIKAVVSCGGAVCLIEEFGPKFRVPFWAGFGVAKVAGVGVSAGGVDDGLLPAPVGVAC